MNPLSPDHRGGVAKVLDPSVGARAQEHPVNGDLGDGGAGLQVHVGKGSDGGVPLQGVVELLRMGYMIGYGRGLSGIGSPRHIRLQIPCVDAHLGVECGAGIGGERTPLRQRLIPSGAPGGVGASLQVGERGLVGGDHPRPGARLDGHVAHRHPPFHGEPLYGRAPVFDHMTLPAGGAYAGDDPQDDVLGGHPGGQVPVDGDGHGAGLGLGKGLGGEDMFHFGGADPERQGAERPMGRGVGVAADDGHARLGHSLFGADHMNDALAGVIQSVQGDAELLAVVNQGVDLLFGKGVADGKSPSGGGHAVVDGGQRQVGPAHRPSVQPEPVEGLGRGDLMNQVQVDVYQGRFALDLPHQMAVPYLFEEGLWRGCDSGETRGQQ